jgi:hypothetical protein
MDESLGFINKVARTAWDYEHTMRKETETQISFKSKLLKPGQMLQERR